MNKSFKKVLVLAPHTDDGELGCGASISKFISNGSEVFYVAFSLCTKSLPKNLPSNTLEIEVLEALKILGVPRSNTILFDFDVRDFNRFRQEILEEMIKIKAQNNFDLVLVPNSNDIHQDHQVIYNEALRAFKNITLFGYELPWNSLNFTTSCFIPIEEDDLQMKIKALSAYKSQAHRSYLNPDFIKGLAITRGTQIGVKFAEAFELIRFVL
jgi:LmbE family N-acetylglucosaminyl deacetylase